VAVHEHDDVGLGGGVDAGHAGAPIAPFDPDHICARASGARGGAVTAPAVGDDDALDEVARDGAHHCADCVFFVQGRYHDGYALLRVVRAMPVMIAACVHVLTGSSATRSWRRLRAGGPTTGLRETRDSARHSRCPAGSAGWRRPTYSARSRAGR